MSQRKTILATGEYYHVYNRSVRKLPIFVGKRECDRFLESIAYYLHPNPPTKFSTFLRNREKFSLNSTEKIVTIVNYALIPNHFHFTLCQNIDNGIREFMRKISSSLAHYLNIKNDSSGPVFENNFQAVHVEDDKQLIHLSRYIHLNPVTAYLVEKPEDYKYSSYRAYIKEEKSEIIDPSIVMDQFASIKDYKKFVVERKDYQRELDIIKHLIIE